MPLGANGKKIVHIASNLLAAWNNRTELELLALDLLCLMPPLLLTRPNAKKIRPRMARDLIAGRIAKWKAGRLLELLQEAIEIHKRSKPPIQLSRPNKDLHSCFAKKMQMGNVRGAIQLFEKGNGGLAPPSDITLHKLLSKHPPAAPDSTEARLEGHYNPPPKSLFLSIDSELVYKLALRMRGAAGPFGLDSQDLRRMLCSNSFRLAAGTLREQIAMLARRMATEDIDPASMSCFLANRLVPLAKGTDDVRPVGIGEVWRRLVAKLVLVVCRSDVQRACGNLQVCGGTPAGCEAAIHAAHALFEQPDTEAALLVDASNAFNQMNRRSALHNVSILCPILFQFLLNVYRMPSALHIPTWQRSIMSTEGTVQGDPAAMAFFALNTLPLIQLANQKLPPPALAQMWYADDATGLGKIEALRTWWDLLRVEGPKIGYILNAGKCILLVKPQLVVEAERAFHDTGITILPSNQSPNSQVLTDLGARHLGAPLGETSFVEAYIKGKVSTWVEELSTLCDLAEYDPHCAYAAYTHGFRSKWVFIQRTTPNIAHLFQPLDELIARRLIPALTGLTGCDDASINLLGLPPRHGGIGLSLPSHHAQRSYEASREITTQMTDLIIKQDSSNAQLDLGGLLATKRGVIKRLEEEQEMKKRDILQNPPNGIVAPLPKVLELATAKGASSWLSCLPIQKFNFTLNKVEFQDAMSMRYHWTPPNFPCTCNCGKENSVSHAMQCMKGGYVKWRHDCVKKQYATLMKEAGLKDVVVEPSLLPLPPAMQRRTPNGGIKSTDADDATLDIAATGLWGVQNRTFFDVRITDPTALSYIGFPTTTHLQNQENEKKNDYARRVQEIEKASFTPLVHTVAGGCGKEADCTIRHLAHHIAIKHHEPISIVTSLIRTRISFALLRANTVCLRGTRGKGGPRRDDDDASDSETDPMIVRSEASCSVA